MKILPSIATLIIAVLFSTITSAEEKPLNFQLGVQYGTLTNEDADDDSKSGAGLGGSVRYLSEKGFGVGLSYYSNKHGEIDINESMVELHYVVPTNGNLSYVFIGTGSIEMSIDDFSSDVDSMVIGMGMIFRSTSKYSYFGDIKYLKPDDADDGIIRFTVGMSF